MRIRLPQGSEESGDTQQRRTIANPETQMACPILAGQADVKPFAEGQKNDYNDAEAIVEATLRPNLRTTRDTTQDELDLQAHHRIRSRLISRRTATVIRSVFRRASLGLTQFC